MATLMEKAPQDTLQQSANGTLQLVSFRLGKEEFGIEITKVREIILMGQITAVPETPPYVKGLINLRSTVIPIVDLRLRFGLPKEPATEQTRIMVLHLGQTTIGIIVDAVSEVLRVSPEQIAPPPPTVASLGNEYLTGLVRLSDRMLILLNVGSLFADCQHLASPLAR